jgi:glycosyltransferase involved in cell wall biosynthesis
LKILVVSQDFPWPPIYGSRLRLEQVIDVATSLGATDLFSLVSDPFGDSNIAPDSSSLRRAQTALRVIPRYTMLRRLRFLASRDLPIEMVVSRSQELREQFLSWADPSYDAVWFSKGSTFDLLGRPRLGPTIVDLDDLEDQKILAQLSATRGGGYNGRHQPVMYAGAEFQARVNARRWGTLQRTIARNVERVVLCSELDASRFGEPNSAIVANGFEIPERPAGREVIDGNPTILLQGMLRYAPNTDAAVWLATSIAPRLRDLVPDLEIRLVGDPNDAVSNLHDPPRTIVVGRVPEMEPELARADLVVVPMRYGSGTRVKILEAMAHRVPVVSTTLGAEGLGLKAGVHLMVADDPDDFAKACAELLSDTERRRSMAEAAYQEFLRRHHWGVPREQIRQLFKETAGVLAH